MKKNKAKTVATLALAGALLTSPLTAMAASFKDVNANHWAYSHISKLSDLRIISGYDDGTFKPTRSVSYLEVLTLLKGIQNPTSAELTQAITTQGHIADAYKVPKWAKPAVCIALQNNVISEMNLKAAYKHGYITDTPKAGQFPGRELIMVYYAKALGIQPIQDKTKIKVKDNALIGKTSKDLTGDVDIKGYYAAMIEAGIFHETGDDGFFNPNAPLKREQMATITDFSYNYRSSQSFEGDVIDNTVINNVATFSIKDKAGKTIGFVLNSNTAVTLNGKVGKLSDITAGSTVKVKAFAQGGGIAPYKAVSVDVIGNDAEGKGIVDSRKNDEIQISYSTKKDVVVDSSFKPEKTANFKFDKDTVITSLGKKIDKSGINVRDLVAFESRNGVLKEVMVYPYSGMVSGEFVNYEYNRFGVSRIVLKLENKQEQDFIVKDEKVAKELFDLSQRINKGYPLTLSTRYHEVVSAKAAESELTGLFEGISLVNYDNGTIEITTSSGKRSYPLDSKIKFIDLGVTTGSDYTPNQLYSALSKYLKKADIELHLTGGKVDQVTVKSVMTAKDQRVKVTMVTPLPKYAGGSNYQSNSWAVNSIDNFTAYRFDFDNTGVSVKENSLSGQLSDAYNSYITTNRNTLQLVYDLFKNEKGQEYFSNVRVSSGHYGREIPLYPLGNITVSK